MTIIKTITYTTVTIASDQELPESLNTSTVGSNLVQQVTPIQRSWIRVNSDGTTDNRTATQTRDDLELGNVAQATKVVNNSDTTTTRIPDISWLNTNVVGIKNSKAVAYAHLTGNIVETVITVQGEFEDISNNFTLSGLSQGFSNASGGVLLYTGDLSGVFKVSVGVDVEELVDHSIMVVVNGSPINSSLSNRGMTECLTPLENGDTVSVVISNNDNTDNLTVSNMSLFVERVL